MKQSGINKQLLLSQVIKSQYKFEADGYQAKLIKEYDCLIDNAGRLAVNIYRIQRQYFLKRKEDVFLKYLSVIQQQFCSCLIYYSADIGKNFTLVHPFGTVIGSGVKIGDNCYMYHQVTIGAKDEASTKRPVIGDNVYIYTGAVIAGDIKIGDHAVIGANSVVFKNVGKGEVWGGAPAKKLRKIKI